MVSTALECDRRSPNPALNESIPLQLRTLFAVQGLKLCWLLYEATPVLQTGGPTP